MDTSIIDKAIIFAVRAHQGQARKGKELPYIVHPMEAVSIVAAITTDQEILAAAALHDTVEDTPVTLDELRREFGGRVATLVAYETNIAKSPDHSWRDIKQEAVNRLASAPLDAQMAAIGDKLSNLRAIHNDYMAVGDNLWSRFKAPGGKEDITWYYRSLAQSLDSLKGRQPFEEFVELLEETFR